MSNSRIVYSTDQGRRCPECARPISDCRCRRSKAAPARPPPGDGIVRVSRETKARKGKGVTIVAGVPLAGADLDELARRLKKRCGSGGTVREGRLEIQGDHRETLLLELRKLGFSAKLAGG